MPQINPTRDGPHSVDGSPVAGSLRNASQVGVRDSDVEAQPARGIMAPRGSINIEYVPVPQTPPTGIDFSELERALFAYLTQNQSQRRRGSAEGSEVNTPGDQLSAMHERIASPSATPAGGRPGSAGGGKGAATLKELEQAVYDYAEQEGIELNDLMNFSQLKSERASAARSGMSSRQLRAPQTSLAYGDEVFDSSEETAGAVRFSTLENALLNLVEQQQEELGLVSGSQESRLINEALAERQTRKSATEVQAG